MGREAIERLSAFCMLENKDASEQGARVDERLLFFVRRESKQRRRRRRSSFIPTLPCYYRQDSKALCETRLAGLGDRRGQRSDRGPNTGVTHPLCRNELAAARRPRSFSQLPEPEGLKVSIGMSVA